MLIGQIAFTSATKQLDERRSDARIFDSEVEGAGNFTLVGFV